MIKINTAMAINLIVDLSFRKVKNEYFLVLCLMCNMLFF